MMERDGLLEARLEELRRDVAVGLDEARRGELIPGADAVRRLEARTRTPAM